MVREAMHSAFLFHAIHAGLDMAIVNAGALMVYDEIPGELKEAVEDVLFMRREGATERLTRMAEELQGPIIIVSDLLLQRPFQGTITCKEEEYPPVSD